MPVLDSYKDRGITYNKHLSYTPHVLNITARASRCAKLILTCFTTQNPDVFMKVFIVYVRPMLEFSSTVWNPMTKQNISKVESVQKRFTKRLVGLSKISYNRRLEIYIYSKANSILGFLCRNLRRCPAKLKEAAYIALVRSTLEYATPEWAPHMAKDINKVENIQEIGKNS